MTACGDCGHPAHAGRCFTVSKGVLRGTLNGCECKTRRVADVRGPDPRDQPAARSHRAGTRSGGAVDDAGPAMAVEPECERCAGTGARMLAGEPYWKEACGECGGEGRTYDPPATITSVQGALDGLAEACQRYEAALSERGLRWLLRDVLTDAPDPCERRN